MDTLRIDRLGRRKLIQLAQDPDAQTCRCRRTYYPEMIAAVADMDTEALFYVPQMFVKLATQIGQEIIVSRFQQKFPGFDCGIQDMVTGFVLVKLQKNSGGFGFKLQTTAQ